MPKNGIPLETYIETDELTRIANRAAHCAQEESRRLGIPNVYSINGIIYYELPNGELSREDPYVEAQVDPPVEPGKGRFGPQETEHGC